eukprot:m.227483 g.227483  ORF g.227483 m.227483 type:complete len:102 (-) comp13871_c1_seq5:54-359(-)
MQSTREEMKCKKRQCVCVCCLIQLISNLYVIFQLTHRNSLSAHDLNRLRLLTLIQHKNVISILGAVVNSTNKTSIILEHCENGYAMHSCVLVRVMECFGMS